MNSLLFMLYGKPSQGQDFSILAFTLLHEGVIKKISSKFSIILWNFIIGSARERVSLGTKGGPRHRTSREHLLDGQMIRACFRVSRIYNKGSSMPRKKFPRYRVLSRPRCHGRKPFERIECLFIRSGRKLILKEQRVIIELSRRKYKPPITRFVHLLL